MIAGADSELVTYVKWSPNHSGKRKHDIDTITIHCVVGQCSVETLGEIFAPVKRQASCQYGIGKDGRIGQYVKEENRSWCTSSSSNDNRAITIEVASDTYHPYAVNDKAYAALIDLVTDICKRNNIKKLIWSTNKNDRINHLNGCNMTVHRDYANKECPGKFLYDRHQDIADKVNARLGNNVDIQVKPVSNTKVKEGDTVKFTADAVQYNGKVIPSAYKNKEYQVKQIRGDRAVLTINNIVIYAVNVKHIISTTNKTEAVEKVVNYKVRVIKPPVEYREKPDINSKLNGTIKTSGVYTIVKEYNGWGYLKSGAGWVYLANVNKI